MCVYIYIYIVLCNNCVYYIYCCSVVIVCGTYTVYIDIHKCLYISCEKKILTTQKGHGQSRWSSITCECFRTNLKIPCPLPNSLVSYYFCPLLICIYKNTLVYIYIYRYIYIYIYTYTRMCYVYVYTRITCLCIHLQREIHKYMFYMRAYIMRYIYIYMSGGHNYMLNLMQYTIHK